MPTDQRQHHTISLVLIEDNPHYAKGLVPDLEALRGRRIGLAGTRSYLDDGLELVNGWRPNIALVDLRISRHKWDTDGDRAENGMTLIKRIVAAKTGTCVIVLTNLRPADNPYIAIAAHEAGARGYLVKDHTPTNPEHLAHIIESVNAGGEYWGPRDSPTEKVISGWKSLDELGRLIIELVADGHTSPQIANHPGVMRLAGRDVPWSDDWAKKKVRDTLDKIGLSGKGRGILQSQFD